MAGTTEVQYFVLPDTTNPYLLARVRWPDVFQAISAARPDWQDDQGLFDLPYSPSSTQVTLERATAIAAGWGARLPDDETPRTFEPTLIRRMPADWSNLSPAEKRAWALEFVPTGRRAGAAPATSVQRRRIGLSGFLSARWRRRRAMVIPSPGLAEVEAGPLPLDLAGAPTGALPHDSRVDLVGEPLPATLSSRHADAVDLPANLVNLPDTNHDGAVHR